jgi:hypothetical protein
MQSFESLSDPVRRTVEMATDAPSEDEQAAEFLFSQSKRDRLFRKEVFGSAEPEIGPLLRLVRECRRAPDATRCGTPQTRCSNRLSSRGT